MDDLKKLTNKSYTAWDLNIPQYVRIKNRQTLERKFKKRAKRKLKSNLKKEVDLIGENNGPET